MTEVDRKSNPMLVKGVWSPEEDARLIALKNTAQAQALAFPEEEKFMWATIAETINSRSAKQCRERWNNSLNPEIKMGKFSADEDKVLKREWKR